MKPAGLWTERRRVAELQRISDLQREAIERLRRIADRQREAIERLQALVRELDADAARELGAGDADGDLVKWPEEA